MTEFWEETFKDKQEMWGWQPVNAAVITATMFAKNSFNHILIPGVGYGRNAQSFLDQGMRVTGIEISRTAIEMAETRFGAALKISHGSVTDMPFDKEMYDGIFCHALIHLLDEPERLKLIKDCHHQLRENGLMVFTAITKDASTYSQGTPIGKDRFEQFGGVQMYFYDDKSIEKEFGDFGLIRVDTVTDNFPFHMIICRKQPDIPQA